MGDFTQVFDRDLGIAMLKLGPPWALVANPPQAAVGAFVGLLQSPLPEFRQKAGPPFPEGPVSEVITGVSCHVA